MTTTNGGPAVPQPEQQTTTNPQLNVLGQYIKDFSFEISPKLEGKAENSGSVMFAFDLTFAGIFRLQNVPQEHLQPILLIECPRLLFPFAPEIVATSVRNGGFAPLLLDPVDFVALYQQRMAQAS